MARCIRCGKPTNRLRKNKPLHRSCESVFIDTKKAVKKGGLFYPLLLKGAEGKSKIIQIFSKIIIKMFFKI